MPRPRKTDGERRSEALGLRLTPAERLQVEQAALEAGLSTSEYVREQVLKGRVVIRQNRSLDHAAFDELRRIGVNLNQLTRLAHQRQQFPAGLTEIWERLDHLLARELTGGPEPGPSDGSPAAAKRDSACGDSSSGAAATDDGA